MPEQWQVKYPSGSGRSTAYCNPNILTDDLSGRHSPAQSEGQKATVPQDGHPYPISPPFRKQLRVQRFRRNMNVAEILLPGIKLDDKSAP